MGGSTWAGMPPGRYTPWWVHTPWQVHPSGRYTSWKVHPQGGTPWQVHPPAGTPPGRYTPQQVHTWAGTHPLGAVHAGRYDQQAGGTHPNWNEFLFGKMFSELKIVRLSCKDCAILSNKSKYLIAVVTV